MIQQPRFPAALPIPNPASAPRICRSDGPNRPLPPSQQKSETVYHGALHDLHELQSSTSRAPLLIMHTRAQRHSPLAHRPWLQIAGPGEMWSIPSHHHLTLDCQNRGRLCRSPPTPPLQPPAPPPATFWSGHRRHAAGVIPSSLRLFQSDVHWRQHLHVSIAL